MVAVVADGAVVAVGVVAAIDVAVVADGVVAADVGGEAAVVEVICTVFVVAIAGVHSVGVVGGGVLLGIQSGIILGQVIGRFLLHVKKVAHRMDVHFRATESMNAYGRLIVMVVNYMCCIISTRTSWDGRLSKRF